MYIELKYSNLVRKDSGKRAVTKVYDSRNGQVLL